ncbi:unnamed protein product [marine sediment metagenome]|uniref:YtxH domain-containing protein n=1 Tax=marine sediment metagenome TaxID=412755 RepID=X0SIG8_9ZZZZ
MGEKGSASGFAIGFALGAVVGLAVALLLAPRPGKETRELLKGKAADIPETVREHTADREKVYTKAWTKRKGRPKVSNSYYE